MTGVPPVPIDAYQGTDFIVFHEGAELVARLGERSHPIDRLLTRLQATSGTFITAWNPFSQARSAAENVAANARMGAHFLALGLRALHHVGRSRNEDWSEDGFFVLDLAPERALAIATEFDQHAVVHVPLGGVAELLLTPTSAGT